MGNGNLGHDEISVEDVLCNIEDKLRNARNSLSRYYPLPPEGDEQAFRLICQALDHSLSVVDIAKRLNRE